MPQISMGQLRFIMVSEESTDLIFFLSDVSIVLMEAAISEGHGDTAVELLRAGAEVDKRDNDDRLAIDTAPDPKVLLCFNNTQNMRLANPLQVCAFVISTAEREGIDIRQMVSSVK